MNSLDLTSSPFQANPVGLKIAKRSTIKETNSRTGFMNRLFRFSFPVAGLILLLASSVSAGPPYLTDDPVPVDYQHWEAYLFTAGDDRPGGGGYTIQGPAAEVNYGAFPDIQLHLVVPLTTVGGGGNPTQSGLGDMELGMKYRFVHETNGWPQLAVFPAVELPTGDAGRGLGNGRAWYRLPLWAEKSWGAWTIDAGGGAALNSAPGQRDYPFGGCLVQREITEHLSLGGEIYAQGQDTDSDRGYAALNFGGTYSVSEHFSLLFSAGHSITGDDHMLWYLGLYWTW